MKNDSSTRWADAAVALSLMAAAWLLYSPVLRLWWTYDDFYHFRHLITGRPWWYLWDGAEFQHLEAKVLTPLLFLSLDLDRRLFGLHAYPFFVHQLLAFSLCPVAFYGVLRLWLRRLPAAVGAWVFLIGPVTASLAPFLFVRHYIEAILLGSLAVAAWMAALRRTGPSVWWLSVLSAALYFAASMAKEIAVPLVVLLPLLPEPNGARRTNFEARLRLALPHVVLLAVYLIVRFETLGTLAGGYGFKVEPGSLPALALALPGKIGSEVVGERISIFAILFLFVLAVGILALLLRSGARAIFLTGTGLLLALLPVLPVSTQMEPRFAVPAWIALAVAFAVGCQIIGEHHRALGAVLGLTACLSGLVLNRQDWNLRFAQAERMSAEDRFLFTQRDGDVLRQPLLLAASIGELQGLKEGVFHRPRGGTWFQDDLYLCAHRQPLGRVWSYDATEHRVTDSTALIPVIRDQFCPKIHWDAPLAASFYDSGGVLHWDLGPRRDGTYSFLIGDGASRFEMPRKAGFQMQDRAPFLSLRVKYESPDEWVTYSPELRVPLEDGKGIRWRRPGEKSAGNRPGIIREIPNAHGRS